MKFKEVEKILPKECWSSVYTEDERIEEIIRLLQGRQEKTKGILADCGLMIETIHGYLDQALETDESNNYEEILKAVDHLNMLNKWLLDLHKKVENDQTRQHY